MSAKNETAKLCFCYATSDPMKILNPTSQNRLLHRKHAIAAAQIMGAAFGLLRDFGRCP